MATPQDPPPNAEREVQELLVVGEQLQAELRALEEQRMYLDSLLRDLRRGRETLENLAKSQPGEEILLPVGAGTFVRATLASNDAVLSTLGAGVVLESPVPAAIERLDERVKSAEQALQRTTEEARKMEAEMQRLNARLQQFG